jgi:hemoglobin/transferrin/lactoferrin receptor protein
MRESSSLGLAASRRLQVVLCVSFVVALLFGAVGSGTPSDTKDDGVDSPVPQARIVPPPPEASEEPETGEPTPPPVAEPPEENVIAPADGPLPEIVGTASRLRERGFDSPYSVSVVSGDTANHRGFRTLPDSLREVPGVMVQKTGHGQGSPFLRGFTGFRTLLMTDGIRLNNAVFRDGPNQYWNTIDPLTVDRIEVVKGPSSVLYGSDAVGGAINVLTRQREVATMNPAGWERRLFYRFGSAERSHTVRSELAGQLNDNVGVLGGITLRDFGDLSAGRDTGKLPNTGYEELDGDLKTVVRLRDDLDLVLAYQAVTQDAVPRTHSTIHSRSFRGTTVGTDLRRDLEQDRHLGYLQLHYTPDDVDWLEKVTWSASFQQQKELEERIRSNLRKRRQGWVDDTVGTWVQLESPSPIGTWTYGVEYYRDEVDSSFREYNADGTLRERRPRGPVADDASYDLFGVYIQDRFRPLEKIEFTLGGRFNYARAQADEVDPDPNNGPAFGRLDEDFDSVVGSARVLYEATDVLNFFAGVSQGFRAPNLSDLTRFDVARSGEVETPAPDLKPEDFVALEVGTKVQFSDRLEGHAAYHYTWLDGAIVRFPTGGLIDGEPEVTKDNVGDGFVHGFELALEWDFCEDFTAFGNVAWLEGEADTFIGGVKEREPLSRMQPAMALLGLRWESPARKYWVEGSVTISDDQNRLSSRDEADTERIPSGGTPGYTAYTLRAGARLWDGLNVFAAIENLTDKDYRVHGSGQNEPGTNVVLGADWRF